MSKAETQIGDYILQEEIGSGGFAKVVLGLHIPTGEKVAIKVLDKMQLMEDQENFKRIEREISILKLVKHKNIIRLYEVMETPQKIYLVMELCEGGELFDYIVENQHLSEEQSCKFFQEIIDALDYLHSQNIVHRDIKPENMLLDKYNNEIAIKVIDFGISTSYTSHSLLKTPCGTSAYAPPEMHKGEEYYGLLSDVWSAGIVLYAMVYGYLPFCEDDEDINIKNIINGDYELSDTVSESLRDLIKHCMDVNPLERYDINQIKDHPWFRLNQPMSLRPGIIVGYNIIPIDDRILAVCQEYGYEQEKVRESVSSNKYDRNSAVYYITLKKMIKEGYDSISDLFSDDFVEYITSDQCLIKTTKEPDAITDSNGGIENNNDEVKSSEDLTTIPEAKPSEENKIDPAVSPQKEESKKEDPPKKETAKEEMPKEETKEEVAKEEQSKEENNKTEENLKQEELNKIEEKPEEEAPKEEEKLKEEAPKEEEKSKEEAPKEEEKSKEEAPKEEEKSKEEIPKQEASKEEVSKDEKGEAPKEENKEESKEQIKEETKLEIVEKPEEKEVIEKKIENTQKEETKENIIEKNESQKEKSKVVSTPKASKGRAEKKISGIESPELKRGVSSSERKQKTPKVSPTPKHKNSMKQYPQRKPSRRGNDERQKNTLKLISKYANRKSFSGQSQLHLTLQKSIEFSKIAKQKDNEGASKNVLESNSNKEKVLQLKNPKMSLNINPEQLEKAIKGILDKKDEHKKPEVEAEKGKPSEKKKKVVVKPKRIAKDHTIIHNRNASVLPNSSRGGLGNVRVNSNRCVTPKKSKVNRTYNQMNPIYEDANVKTKLSHYAKSKPIATYKSGYKKNKSMMNSSLDFNQSSIFPVSASNKKTQKDFIELNKQNIKTVAKRTKEKVDLSKKVSEFKMVDNSFPSKKKPRSYKGPIDVNYIIIKDLKEVYDLVLNSLEKMKIYSGKVSPYKFHCTKNGDVFDIEICSIDRPKNFDLYYLLILAKQGNFINNHKKLIKLLLSD